MRLGIALNLANVIIESDAESILKSCTMLRDPPFDIAVLVRDCLTLKDLF